MPETDDVTLIVLKGHLLVEEMLVELVDSVFPHPEYLDDANLMFHKLACAVRAAVKDRHDDPCWKLIFALNALRNDLAHKLESSKRQNRIKELFDIHDNVQPDAPYMLINKTGEASLSDADRLRLVIEDSMKFLASIMFSYTKGVVEITPSGSTRSPDS